MQECDSARAMRAGLLMAEREHFIQTQVFAGGPKKDYFYFALRSLNCTFAITKSSKQWQKKF
ncbi:MAG: hypothetical protein IJ160_03225 [Muribaculaceae bacterium]|nr:hypothetical protein [Muribaculaceae bacterium]